MDTTQTIEMLVKNATPILKISHVDFAKPKWTRNVKDGDHRKGPWHHLVWNLQNKEAWMRREPCMYLVIGADGKLRYVGISRNRMKDRWRVSPAFDATSGEKTTEKELFHSQCQKWIEEEAKRNNAATFDIKCLHGANLIALLKEHKTPISAFLELGDDFEGIAAAIERWICNRSGTSYYLWNTAMTC